MIAALTFLRRCRTFPLGLMGALLLGCGGPDNVGGVSGKVTLDGQPLPDARVTFSPTKEGGSSALGKTDSSGYYSLKYNAGYSGAELGENQVTISTYDAGNPDADPPQPAVPEKVPVKYNAKTELKVEVKPGSNTFDFPLEAGPVVQPVSGDEDEQPTKGSKGPRKKQQPNVESC
jgi:hypothetical protein